MTTITGDGGWRVMPLGGPAGTGVRLVREDAADDPAQPRMVGTERGARGPATAQLLGGLALGGAGIASTLAGGPLGARLGATGIGKGLGIALGIGAIAGAAFLLHRSSQNATTEYQLTFAAEPDLAGVAPGDVYATLRAHHERNAPGVERELAALLSEEKVRSYSGIIGANGFVVDVVNRHRDEVEQRLAAIQEVGDVVAAPLS
jgi:hypothetical protein